MTLSASTTDAAPNGAPNAAIGSISAKAKPPLLSVRNLSKVYVQLKGLRTSRLHVLSDVSFDVERGEVVALVGESGCGKSTTARLLARLVSPSCGSVRLDGVNVLQWRSPPRSFRARVQMIFQDPFGSLNPVQTIGHHLERPLRIHHKAKGGGETRDKIEELLSTVGLNPASEYAAKYPHELSGGQRQRVAFARALARSWVM